MDGFFWDSFITRREIVYSKLHFIYHTWKVYLSPWNFELRVNLFDSPSLISSTYHWFIDAKRHWKCNAVILMMPYFVEHNAVKIIFFPVKSVISLVLFSLVPIVGNNFFLNDWQNQATWIWMQTEYGDTKSCYHQIKIVKNLSYEISNGQTCYWIKT